MNRGHHHRLVIHPSTHIVSRLTDSPNIATPRCDAARVEMAEHSIGNRCTASLSTHNTLTFVYTRSDSLSFGALPCLSHSNNSRFVDATHADFPHSNHNARVHVLSIIQVFITRLSFTLFTPFTSLYKHYNMAHVLSLL